MTLNKRRGISANQELLRRAAAAWIKVWLDRCAAAEGSSRERLTRVRAAARTALTGPHDDLVLEAAAQQVIASLPPPLREHARAGDPELRRSIETAVLAAAASARAATAARDPAAWAAELRRTATAARNAADALLRDAVWTLPDPRS